MEDFTENQEGETLDEVQTRNLPAFQREQVHDKKPKKQPPVQVLHSQLFGEKVKD